MARPRIDVHAVREQIILIAETLLVESSGQRLVLSDIALRMGVSQPYIYRHFKNKNELVAELIKRWFHKVESTGHEICRSDKPWQDKLRAYILEMLRLKRTAYEANSQLFVSYLQLAQSHKGLVEQHVQVLVDQITQILAPQVPEKDLEDLVNFTLDATVQFRVPTAIVSAPSHATPLRATMVLDAVIAFVEHRTA